MTPETFAHDLFGSVVEGGCSKYRAILETETSSSAKDPYWKRVLSLYHSLDGEQKGVIHEMTRQIIIDTVANLLSVIDGTTCLSDSDDEQSILTFKNGAILSGDLHNLFLATAERNG